MSAEERHREFESLTVQDTTYQTRLTRKFRERRRWVPPDPRQILCIIPGVIQKVYVRPGQQISRGDPLVVLEAMKMQNDVLCPVDGTVKNLKVTAGDQVAKGQVLLELA